jgi:3-oxoacyl-[acyl-carrier-protein] synthase II
MDAALKRGAKIFAEIRGFGTSADKGQGLEIAMRQALKESGTEPGDIDSILAAASSSIEGDRREARAIKDVFAKQAKILYISAVKSMTGEQYSNSGSFQAAAAVAAIEKGMLPPQINYREKDPLCDLNIITKPTALRTGNIVVNACGKGGISSSMVISKFQR